MTANELKEFDEIARTLLLGFLNTTPISQIHANGVYRTAKNFIEIRRQVLMADARIGKRHGLHIGYWDCNCEHKLSGNAENVEYCDICHTRKPIPESTIGIVQEEKQ